MTEESRNKSNVFLSAYRSTLLPTMTIRNNWCSTCEETVNDHSTICTTCGESLGPPPPSSRRTSNSATSRPPRGSSNTTTTFRVVPEFWTEEIRQAGREFQNQLLSDFRGQLGGGGGGLSGTITEAQVVAAAAAAAAARGRDEEEQWEEIPAELLTPQNTTYRGRPTSKAIMANIPRIVLHDKSSLFRQASFNYGDRQVSAIPAEFGPTEEGINLSQVTIVIGSPRTVKGGRLDLDCQNQIRMSKTPLVYLERGDDVTFVQKAFQAQQAGAVAVVIGNNQSTPWPYIMRDSPREAQRLGLHIPVVMIPQHEGKNLLEYCNQRKRNSAGHLTTTTSVQGELNILSRSMDCAVCCETYHVGDTIMTLPACGHVFHEKCALAWLTKHNTCPFCRRELPTDDTEYEEERRRTQRTHAGSGASNTNSVGGQNESQWSEFYG